MYTFVSIPMSDVFVFKLKIPNAIIVRTTIELPSVI